MLYSGAAMDITPLWKEIRWVVIVPCNQFQELITATTESFLKGKGAKVRLMSNEWVVMDLSAFNLKNSNLPGIDLSRYDLSGWDFSGSNLENAKFSGANLGDAIMKNCELKGADFSGAYLNRINFSNFDRADLRRMCWEVFQHKHTDTLIHGETHVEIRKDGRIITLPQHLEAHGTVQRYRELVKSRICTLQTTITTVISEKTHGNLAIASN